MGKVNWKNLILLAIILSSPTVWAKSAERSSEVYSWDKTIPEKGYVLSVDLFENKNCSQIWTKQIPDFKQKNPQIKDPNLIQVHQEILVQNCNSVVAPENPVKVREWSFLKEKIFYPYVGVYTGASFLSKEGNDSEKLGYNLGIKLGYDLSLGGETLGLALGYMFNQSKTLKDHGNGLYEVDTHLVNLEAHIGRVISEKLKTGFLVNLVMGEDVSLEENFDGPRVGVYGGVDSFYKLSSDLELETNLQHRLDDLSRINFLFNLGLKFHF